MSEDDDPEIFKKPKNEREFARMTERLKRHDEQRWEHISREGRDDAGLAAVVDTTQEVRGPE